MGNLHATTVGASHGPTPESPPAVLQPAAGELQPARRSVTTHDRQDATACRRQCWNQRRKKPQPTRGGATTSGRRAATSTGRCYNRRCKRLEPATTFVAMVESGLRYRRRFCLNQQHKKFLQVDRKFQSANDDATLQPGGTTFLPRPDNGVRCDATARDASDKREGR